MIFIGLGLAVRDSDSCSHIMLPLFWFTAKTGFLLFVFIWIRGTLPRFRYDQLMAFAWKFLFPVALDQSADHRLSLSRAHKLIRCRHRPNPVPDLRAASRSLSAISLVVQTHPISSALSLVGVMGSLAVLYLLLGAEFIAAAQMIVYAGAIMVLFVFVIMLLNAGAEARRSRLTIVKWFGIPLFAFFIGLIELPHSEPAAGRRQGRDVRFLHAGRRRWRSGARCSPHTCCRSKSHPLLILIAIIGAVVLARKEI